MPPVVQQKASGPKVRGSGDRVSEKPVGKHGGLSADASVGSVLRTLHTEI